MQFLFYPSIILLFEICLVFYTLIEITSSKQNSRAESWIERFSDDNLTDIPKNVLNTERKFYYPIKKLVQISVQTISSDRELKSIRKKKIQVRYPKTTKFFCQTDNTRSAVKPDSVHQLRPGDIDVIGAIGASMVVGLGSFAQNILEVNVEDRGFSFSIGGNGDWRKYLTLPNIIKEFNPNLKGYSYGSPLAEERGSQFNVAETGALSQDVLFQAKEIVNRIKNSKRINYLEDWKQTCNNDSLKITNTYRENIYNALYYLKINLPKTFVNLIMSLDVVGMTNFVGKPLLCSVINPFECPCMFGMKNRNRLHIYHKFINEFRNIEKEVVQNQTLNQDDDFTVVLQPFTEDLIWPVLKNGNTDMSLLSADCFHLSQKGYARAANALWNNMMEPVGQKTTNWSKEFSRFLCPTQTHPYIRTWKNSFD
ncbi:phospholipase B1, membrane-associated-like isoform X4 [Daktulosphaira vitifoliae]|uniref:phospholipase B1, membrane-associated-like isoform X4 n=1 Tax=Daktulosphaira vitifoliae TaxID=58002 RepID=UPI0021AABC5C|nr:phospholipase B1, membrane-associated-like isoform X4 [Daktulosphaira vitifoliae]